ncbi:MAG: protein kinase domain-containing protein [Planctomycetota bacterium]|jgi:serine/threonine protein kinase/WD40 repeat protein
MSDAEDKKNKRPSEKEVPPTASFDGSVIGPGGQIGPFRIERELGRGGAGVVYLAHDTKLDREVAIKSLPPEVKDNPKALSRFTREAKVLASLNHPNIATIYEELEEAEGVDYLVLEYVPGQTLAERIVKKPLKLGEALTIALQIAEAVAAAHERDVIHRDLKPGNIKITQEGKVKVLDFGLAKVVGGEATEQQTTITEPGRVIGTPAYMSPEQARGQATDKRADIWSFGCVLFEMLTATVPFKGETISDTLANILQTNPNWQALPQSTPTNIVLLLRRCLEKDPCRRLRDIGDAGIEIHDTLSLPVTSSPTGSPAPIKSRSTLWWVGIACSLVGLIVGLIAANLFFSESTAPSLSESSPSPTRRTVIRLPENQVLGIFHSTTFGLRQPSFALSPDGTRLVYVAHIGGTTQLFERMMNQFEVRPIMGTEGASAPFFSPDGQSVGFFANEKLNRISLLGGEVVNICSSIGANGGSWGSDGMMYFTKGERLLRVPASGGEPEPLGSESEIPGAGYPQVLPGNKAVLISSKSGAMLYSLETGDKRILVPGGQHVRYVPTGHLIYVQAGAIEAVPFNLTTLEVAGRSIPILEGVLLDSRGGSGQSVGQLAFSEEGLLVYAPGSDIRRSIPTWLDRQGNLEPLSMPARLYGTLKLSPDGKRLAILVHDLQSNIHIYDIARGMETRLTLEGDNYYPLWTLDSERVVFSCRREADGQYDLLWALADGSGKPELLHSGPIRLAPYSWSPDGKLLAVYDYVEFRDICDILVLSLEGERKLEPIIQTPYIDMNPAFSPDGRWIAYSSNRDGKYQIYVRPYPTMDRVIPISREFGEEPVWSIRGDRLFYRNRSKWMVVSISTKPEFEAGTPQVVFEGPYVNVAGLSYDVAPDGQRFLVLKPEYDDSQVRELHVVTNWFEELKRLAPTGKNQ